MGEALGAADEVVVLDVYLAREDPDPAVTGALVADAVPLPSDQVAFVARPRRRTRRARGPGPSRRPRAHARRRERHRRSGPRVLELLAAGAAMRRKRPQQPSMTDTAEPCVAARRFARRQWARRWLTWRPVLAVVLRARPGPRRRLDRLLLLVPRGRRGRGRPAPAPSARPGSARPPPSPAGEPLARVDLAQIRSRVQALAAVRSADVTRAVARPGADPVRERTAVAVVEIGGRLRGMDADGVVFRGYRHAPPPGCRTSRPRPTPGRDALAEARQGGRRAAGRPRRQVDHVEVETVDQITSRCATAAPSCGGARRSPTSRPRWSPPCCTSPGTSTTSPSPASRPSGGEQPAVTRRQFVVCGTPRAACRHDPAPRACLVSSQRRG